MQIAELVIAKYGKLYFEIESADINGGSIFPKVFDLYYSKAEWTGEIESEDAELDLTITHLNAASDYDYEIALLIISIYVPIEVGLWWRRES